ncbi:MAG TPA: hypothetical protein VN896_14265 [Methylomirabilota bacterium]|jgi:hypothetical protein|nr:hypothetical protein [Methylomirabilota bacterium]
MLKLRELVGTELHWIQPHALRREFELRAGEQAAATLAFRSTFGSLATATTDEGSWTFKRVGFWRSHVTVRESGRETDLAVFRNDTWTAGGTLTFADGRAWRANTNFWMTSYQFTNASDQPLVRFTKLGGVIHLSCNVQVEPAGVKLPELPWLMALGLYLIVKMRDDAGGAAAAAAG